MLPQYLKGFVNWVCMPQVAVPLPKQTPEAEQNARASQQWGQLADASLHPAAAARALVLPSCSSGNPLKTHIPHPDPKQRIWSTAVRETAFLLAWADETWVAINFAAWQKDKFTLAAAFQLPGAYNSHEITPVALNKTRLLHHNTFNVHSVENCLSFSSAATFSYPLSAWHN